MSTVILLSLMAAFGYLSASWLQWRALKARVGRHPSIRKLIAASLFAQACSMAIHASTTGLSFGFFQVSASLTWLVMLVLWVSDLKQPVASLYIGFGPLAAIAVTLRALLPVNVIEASLVDGRLWVHIGLSLLAYGMLTVATVQAFCVFIQDRGLHSGHPSPVIRALPPLQTMDRLLLQFLLVGMTLLTAGILTGFYFLEDMFAQHVAHKTILSIVAWGLFATLLLGRYIKGWRGALASKWTMAGFAVLMLAFFGSKFVLELLVGRT